MSLPVIAPTDFTGTIKISTDEFREDTFEDFILEYYPLFVRQIIGDDAFIEAENNDFSRYNDLLLGTDYVDDEGKNQRWDGLVISIRKFIYFTYVRDNMETSRNGKVHGASANSERLTPSEVLNVAISRFTSGVISIKSGLPMFLDTYKEITTTIISSSEVATVYTLLVPSTLYLDEGLTVLIEDTEYAVTNVVLNTSFDLVDTTGKDFTGLTMEYKPFNKVDYTLPQAALMI